MKIEPPIVDPRTEPELLRSLDARAPGFIPEWRRSPGGADDALAQVFARFTAIFLEGLRQVPERGFLAFLDLIGTRLLPAQAARAPLVFQLMENATTDSLLTANSEIAATVEPPPVSALLTSEAPPAASQTAVFATDKMITLVRARLAALYSLHPGGDEFADHTPRLTSGITFFGKMGPTEHALYLGHDELFALSSSSDFVAQVRLSVQLAPGGAASQPLDIVWEYLSADGWLQLELDKGSENKKSDDGTDGFTQDGQIVLFKTCGPDAKSETIAGHTSYWIRGVLRTPLPPEDSDAFAVVPVLESIRARVSFVKANLLAEAAATDGFELDLTTTFFPFGQEPARFTTFQLASKEVFQRRGARVSIQFQLAPNVLVVGTAVLAWEYFDGKMWRSIDAFEFIDDTEGLTKSGAITFVAPPDWAETTIAGKKNFWLRVRIDDGDYGKPLELKIEGSGDTMKVSAAASSLKPPVIGAVTLQYSYQTDAETLDHCLAFNDFVFADHTHACLWPREFFQPFRPLEERLPAVHFGFDQPLPQGLVSLFVHLPGGLDDEASAQEKPAFVWEFLGPHGWEELGVLDETSGFRRTGMIQFIGPKEAIAAPGLGGALYRIRARLKTGEELRAAPVAAIWMNAVWATHRFFVKKEELGVSDGNPGQTFYFRPRTPAPAPPPGAANAPERPVIFRQGTPVLEGEIVEVREWAGRGLDYETAIQGVPPEEIRYERDRVTGAVIEVWLRWHEQPHLFESGPTDRHYVIERATGFVRFGDDTHGRIPLAGSRIVVTYGTGGGLAGNVPAGAIHELRSAVPFLKSVANPIAALGGAEAETIEAVQPRGAHRLRHGDRAVSASDIEWIARDASPAVARARCLAVTGPVGRGERGWITVAVLPHSLEAEPAPTPELERELYSHLAARVPAGVAGRVRIIAPAYVPVGVVAEIVPHSPEEAARLEARLLRRLDDFLHPLTGGAEGRGWPFGQPLHLSQIAALLETTAGVDYVVAITLCVGDELFGDLVPVGPDALIAAGDHELKLTLGEN